VSPRDSLRWQSAGSLRPGVYKIGNGPVGRRLDGKPAAASTSHRKRAVLYNALEYAVERQLLPNNPLAAMRVRTRRAVEEVDRRVVVNPEQAAHLFAAVASKASQASDSSRSSP
jgi:hypothetical protein